MNDTEIDELFKGLEEYKKEVTSSKEKSRAFLIRLGIVNNNGELTEPYKDLIIN